MNRPRLCRGSRTRCSVVLAAMLVLFLAPAASVAAAPTCTTAAGATMAFGTVVALASTGDQTTNSGTTFWVNCTSEVTSAPAVYSSTARVIVSGSRTLPLFLSSTGPGGSDLPANSPGAPLAVSNDGTNQTVTLYGRIRAADFKALPSGVYTQIITLTIEY